MAENPARATEFYTKVFGWEIRKWDGPEDYWLITTGAEDQPGINGGIAKSQGPPMAVNTVDVSSVDEKAIHLRRDTMGTVIQPYPLLRRVNSAKYRLQFQNCNHHCRALSW